MTTPKPITETMVFHVRDGVDLEDVPNSKNPGAQAFVRLLRTVQDTPAVQGQFWGLQVENPHLLTWLVDLESMEAHTAAQTKFAQSPEFASFLEDMGAVFDLDKPNTITFTHMEPTEGRLAALRAPVTEVAFLKMPNSSAEARNAVDIALEPIMSAVEKYGKATGGAGGWVTTATRSMTAKGQQSLRAENEDWTHAVFGYASIDDHMTWRQHPEHDRAVQIFEELHAKGFEMRAAPVVPGVDAETGWFHVRFHEGI